MKTLAKASAPRRTRLPDFGGTLRSLNPNRIETVRGLGKLRLRSIRPDDEPKMVRFHERISEKSVYLRYFEYLGLDCRTTHERLARVCSNTPDSYALVAERMPEGGRPAEIMAVGRLTKTADPHAASVDTLLADDAHKRTIRRLLLSRLVALARAFGFQLLIGDLLIGDQDTLDLCRKLGFSAQTLPEASLVRVTLYL